MAGFRDGRRPKKPPLWGWTDTAIMALTVLIVAGLALALDASLAEMLPAIGLLILYAGGLVAFNAWRRRRQ